MKLLNDLHNGAAEFEFWLEEDLKTLKRHRYAMKKEKDTSKIKDILKTLGNLKYDLSRYKKWAVQEVEEIEKHETRQ